IRKQDVIVDVHAVWTYRFRCWVRVVYETAYGAAIQTDDRSCNPSDVISSGRIQRVGGNELPCDRKGAVERRKSKIECMRAAGVVAVGRGARDDSGMGIDAEAGRQCCREGQAIACGGGGEVAGDVEREGLAFIGALVSDGSSGRSAVADGEIETLADGLAVGVGSGDRDRVVAEVAVGRGARDDAGMGIDAEAGRQRSRERQSVAGGRRGEGAGGVEREGRA